MLNAIAPAFTRLSLQLEPPAAILTLNNPPLNVIDLAMMDELNAALTHLAARDDISIVVVTGAGENFSAGVDIKAHLPETVRDMLAKFGAIFRTMLKYPKVLIAGVRGNCLGGGAELAIMCDMIYCTEESRWGFPEIQLACFPPAAAVGLAAAIGQKRATEMVLTGHIIHGDEAMHIGLVNDAVPDGELDDRVQEVAQQLANLSPAALRVTKKALYYWDAMHFDKGLAKAENIYTEDLLKTQDAREGIIAWIEKRQPRWTGK